MKQRNDYYGFQESLFKQNRHSENCCYQDEDLLLYASMEISEDRRILVSAEEVSLFDKYLELAKSRDFRVRIDFEASERQPLKIVYGGLVLQDSVTFEEAKEFAEKGKNCALIEFLEDPEKIVASAYEDILFYPEFATKNFMIPFAALMSTYHEEEHLEASVTLFPYCGRFVWEDMANRVFALACRKFEKVSDDLDVGNWRARIDFSKLEEAYRVADLYTGPVEED